MRKLIAIIAVMLIALPAGASTGDIGRSDHGTPTITRDTQEREDAPADYAILGSYFYTVTPDRTERTTVVPADAIRYEVHADGTVTFETGTVEETEPAPLIADVTAEEWEEYEETADPEDVARYHSADVRPI